MPKRIKLYLTAFFILLISSRHVLADDMFTSAENSLSEINNLILQCEEAGLECDMQRAYADIIRQFIIYGREDLAGSDIERAAYISEVLDSLADKAVSETENILEFNKSISVPKYSSQRLYTQGMNFKTGSGETIFLGGYLIFSNEQDKMSDFVSSGNNFYTWEIGPNSTIVEEGTFLPSWTASVNDGISIEEDDEAFHSGGKSVKIIASSDMSSGHYAELSQSIMIKPGKTYEVELWLKGENARGNMIYLNGTSEQKTLPTGTYDWKKVTYEVSAQPEQTSLLLRITAQGTGTLWIDDIIVREKGRDYNFLNNSGFEDEWAEGEFLVNRGVMNYIQAVMEESEENNIANMILLSPHYIPDWFFENYPEANGYQEGFLKGNVINETYRKFIKTHVRAVAAAAAPFSNLHSLVLTNEPIYSTIYWTDGKQIFKDAFIEYLKEKYNSFDSAVVPQEMRENWGISDPGYEWSEVSMPPANTITGDGRFWDWMEFNNEIFTGFHKWLADMVHEVDDTIPVHAKLYDPTFNRGKLDKGIDAEELYSYLDYNGTDGGMNYESTREGFLHIRMAEDLANSIADKPMVNSENHIVPDNCDDYSYKHALVAGADLWQGFLHGRTASAAWVWRRHDTYPEYKHSIAYRPDVVQALSEKLMNANRFAGSLEKLQNADKNFYILYSNAALLYNEEAYMSACNNAYEALWSLGQRVSFVTEKQIAAGELPQDGILVIPSTANIDECALSNLNLFEGRTVVIGNTPSKNEYNREISVALKNSVTVSDSLEQIRAVFADLLDEKNIEIITLKNSDGHYIGMTDIRVSYDGTSVLINACNNTWEPVENVSAYIGDIKLSAGYDIINDTTVGDSFTLAPFEPMLLSFEAEEADGSLKNVRAYARNNGALIKWEGGDGAVFVRSGGELLGSVLSKNGYINITGLENGVEYTFEVSSENSEEIAVKTVPNDEEVSVFDEGPGENGHTYRLVNNTNSEIKYSFTTHDATITMILPPWGEKLIQTGE